MRVQTSHKAPRAAFTMIELIVVILIIAILMAFLFPAIGRAIGTARNATVVSEIKNFEKAISEFKLKFGVEPPSTFILYEKQGDGTNGNPNWNTDGSKDKYDLDGDGDTDNNDRSLRRRQSVAFLRQAFPNFNFETANFDFNGDGDFEDTLVLNGAECLLFFLGGMTATEDGSGTIRNANGGTAGSTPRTPTKWVPLGFSANPATPFARGGTRIGPFYEFDSGRIVNVSAGTDRQMPEYLDPLPGQLHPYIYVSANEGRGYSNNDLDIDHPTTLSPTLIYTEDAAGLVPYNMNSFQIISPGADQQYGTGGFYDKDKGFTGFSETVQKDNITNFTGGVMDAS